MLTPLFVRGLGIVLVLIALFLSYASTASATFPGRNGVLVVAVTNYEGGIGFAGSLRLVNPRTGHERRIGLCSAGDIGHPAPRCAGSSPAATSPDGRWVASLILDRYPEGRGDVGTYLLSEFPFGGGPALKTALIERPVDRYCDLYSEPRWSPDGSRLVVTRINGFAVQQLAFVGRDGHLTGPVIDHADRPDWSSTGRILYQSAGEAIPVPDLFVGKPSGPFRRLVRNGNSASWSPDGRRIAFVRKGGIYIVPVRGGSARRIVKPGPWVETFGGGRVRSYGSALPVWSPDGRQIVFVRSGQEARRLYAVNPKTRRVHRLSDQRIDDDQIDSLDWRALPGDQGG